MDIPEERECGLDAAEARIEQVWNERGIRCQLDILGQGPHVVFAQLFEGKRLISCGAGKGDLRQAVVGAKYEAFEHYLTDFHGRRNASIIRVSTLLETYDPAVATTYPLQLLADQLDASVGIRTFDTLTDNNIFHYPLGLSLPGYDDSPIPGDTLNYGALRRYATNSGTAIGGTAKEATLHALNECIERDALSIFLLTHFYYREDAPLRVVDINSLSDDLRKSHGSVVSMIEALVVIIDISTSLSVTTCLAFARTEYGHAHIVGVGASLNPTHAARRALTELLQLHLASTHGGARGDTVRADIAAATRHLARFPALLRCQMLSMEPVLRHARTTRVTLRDETLGSVTSQVSSIASDLKANGLVAGRCVLSTSGNGIALVNVVVPAFERFFIVGSGHVVVPGARGRRLAKATERSHAS